MMLRRARGAAALLLAAAGVALAATTLLAALAMYGRAAADAGAREAIASADPAERSILVRGTAGGDPRVYRDWNAALRRTFGGGLGGVPVTVSEAGYGAGWALAAPAGQVPRDTSGVAYANVMSLADLSRHAELATGRWPAPGASPPQATLAEPAARLLGHRPGDRVPLADRRTGRITQVLITGVWRIRDARDPYWRLTPDVRTGVAPQSATYGPLVVDRADFADRFAVSASVAWQITPDLSAGTLGQVRAAAAAAAAAGTGLPAPRGLNQSATAETGLPGLAARLVRADLVSRSALVTPMLLIIALAGYCLLLVAALLAEHRRAETALLRARGASRIQLAGLAVREALLIVLPAALLGPPAAAVLVQLAGPSSTIGGAGPPPRLTGPMWMVAAIAAIGCATVVTAPAAGRGRAYAVELAARFRPLRNPAVVRAGLDLVLVALAVLGWLQLRQYASPLAAGAGDDLRIDPLLAAAPTFGVIAGAVLTLRLLSPAARLTARLADRRSGTAALFGAWQVARRARAGPMLLIALAVAAGTVSWCLAGTAQRSTADQADLRAGADLRVVETAGAAPVGRAAELARLPGVATALPGWRAGVPLGPGGGLADLVAVDAAAAARVVPLRDDVAGGDPDRLWRVLAAARAEPAVTVLPAPGRLTGVLRTSVPGVRTTALFAAPHGGYLPVRVAPGAGGRFTLAPPAGADPPRLAGFLVSGPDMLPLSRVDWQLDGLDPLPAGGRWQVVDRRVTGFAARPGPAALAVAYSVSMTGRVDFAVVPAAAPAPVPVAATPAALTALRLQPGQAATVTVGGVPVEVTVAGAVEAVPGTAGGPALLADLPSLAAQMLGRQGVAPSTQEWWLATRVGDHPSAAAAAARLPAVQLVDRQALADSLSGDPFGAGARTALFGAALAAVLLAAVGVAVDVQATTRRRAGELTVLYTLGSTPRLLTRSLLVEQAMLAGFGALTGLLTGVLVAGAMAPLLVLTSAAARPVPAPLLVVDWPRVAGTGVGLVLLALGLTALAAHGLRRRLAATRLTIGAEP